MPRWKLNFEVSKQGVYQNLMTAVGALVVAQEQNKTWFDDFYAAVPDAVPNGLQLRMLHTTIVDVEQVGQKFVSTESYAKHAPVVWPTERVYSPELWTPQQPLDKPRARMLTEVALASSEQLYKVQGIQSLPSELWERLTTR